MSFRSTDHIFHKTSLAQALETAGLKQAIQLVREPAIEGILRDKNDNWNIRPSSKVHLKPRPETKTNRRAA